MRAHLRHGVCLYENLLYEQALQSFEKALSIDPKASGVSSWVQKVHLHLSSLHLCLTPPNKTKKALQPPAALEPVAASAAPVASKPLACKRFGCGATFLESSNSSSSCLYHEGPAEY